MKRKKKHQLPIDRAETPETQLELVFGIAGAVGINLGDYAEVLGQVLKNYGYIVEPEIRLSQMIRAISDKFDLTDAEGKPIKLKEDPEEERVGTYMDAGNAIRRMHNDKPALANAAAVVIARKRKLAGDVITRRAYIIRSLKRPEEASVLRRIYGSSFFLIGVNVSREERVRSLTAKIARSYHSNPVSNAWDQLMATKRPEAEALAKRDEEEADDCGQALRDVFQIADFFVTFGERDQENAIGETDRFVRLILGDLSLTPRPGEQLMFQAFASSLASGSLSRQVGAVLSTPEHEILGVGWNDVPKGGGGLYRSGDHYDVRDITLDRDTQSVKADEMLKEILAAGEKAGWFGEGAAPSVLEARRALAESRVMHLLEFGRTSHAEMEAIVSAGRTGSRIGGSTLYTTTFPCHECARLILTAGIRKVVFIEPYEKSRALELHGDALFTYDDEGPPSCRKKGCHDLHHVELRPFFGVGPRRFIELFAMVTYRKFRRKNEDGYRFGWAAGESWPKIEAIPFSYREREYKIGHEFLERLKLSAADLRDNEAAQSEGQDG